MQVIALRYHLIHKSFPCGLASRETSQYAQNLGLARGVWFDFSFRIHVQQEQSEIATTTTLSGF
jgi:hypothetical protein